MPKKAKTSVVAIMQKLAEEKGQAIKDALLAGIQARPPKSFPYLQLLAHYIDGKPADHVRLTGPDDGPVQFDLTGLTVDELRALRPILQKLEAAREKGGAGE